MFNLFNNHSKVRNLIKKEINLSSDQCRDQIISNRKVLNQIPTWIEPNSFQNSFFNYGVPDHIKSTLDLKINNDLTYSDIMLYLATTYFDKPNYLEIGVSVGKNFLQIVHGLPKANDCVGFDIEEINPVLEQQFTPISKVNWPTMAGSIKKNESSLSNYLYRDQRVNYLSGDIWDTNSWARLKNNQFNLIFSDALHTPKAILYEFNQIHQYQLLADQFIIVWDDLVGKMQNSFYKIIDKYHKLYDLQEIYLIEINGWLGEHEGKHSVGIISNIKFD